MDDQRRIEPPLTPREAFGIILRAQYPKNPTLADKIPDAQWFWAHQRGGGSSIRRSYRMVHYVAADVRILEREVQSGVSSPTGESDLNEQAKGQHSGKHDLRPSPDDEIRAAITDVFDRAEREGCKPPNRNELPLYVHALLQDKGLHTSTNHIKKLSDEPRYVQRRGQIGKRDSRSRLSV
jgi:hypothetical protein